MCYLTIFVMLLFSTVSVAGELWTKYDSSEMINCITNYGDYIWIGTNSGVIKMNRYNKLMIKYTTEDSLIKNNIDFITADSKGYIFAGTKYTIENDYDGGISIYNGDFWIKQIKGTNYLAGSNIMGLKANKNGTVWAAVNDCYFEEIDNVRYCRYNHSIQYCENSIWKTFYSYANSIITDGNWGSVAKLNIKCFDIADLNYYIFIQEGSYYENLFLSNGSSGIYIDNTHHPTWVYNVAIGQLSNSGRIIYVNALFSDGIQRLVCGESDKISGRNIWTILTPPDSYLYFSDVMPITDKNNNEWFLLKGVFGNVCLMKFDNINYELYESVDIGYTTTPTFLYADEQGYIWLGTNGYGLWRFDANNATAVESEQSTTPSAFTLTAAYPNPFNANTTISFSLNKSGKVNLAIYNLAGQKVRELAKGNYTTGSHTAVWDGKDDSGNAVSSGVYLARMESGGASKVVRMAMVK